jgi:cytochrome b
MADDTRHVVAWDLPTRLFHWTLVTLIALAWVSRKYGDANLVWHTWNGYAILVLVVWRVLWGFVGSSTARFVNFFHWPWTAARYGLDFVARRPRHYLGHNPLGGSVVFLMLGLVGLQGLLGLFSYDDHTSNAGGPLAGRVADATWAAATKWHLQVFDALLAVIALHLIANMAYLVWRGENLIKPMITGRKTAAEFEDMAEARVVGGAKALACLAIAIAIVLGGIRLAGGRLF